MAYGYGVVHKSVTVINEFLGKWIEDAQRNRLSLHARYTLAMYEWRGRGQERWKLWQHHFNEPGRNSEERELKAQADRLSDQKIQEEVRKEQIELED